MRKKHFFGIGVFLIVVLFWALRYHPGPHPSDQTLADYFQKHQADFDRLAVMANEDVNVRWVLWDSVILKNGKLWPKETEEGFSKERWTEYQNIFVRLKEYQINELKKFDNIIYFQASYAQELDNSEYVTFIHKGYAYSSKEPTPLVESLDGMGFDSKERSFKKISGHWHLYHWWGRGRRE